jgi:chorismate synthase
MIRFLTAGESHGKGLTVVLEGLPAHLDLSSEDIDAELSRRQAGYGRGGRMKIETDRVEILSGVRRGKTLGSPITLWIPNKDYENWAKVMSPGPEASLGQPLKRPRPGHADLAGGLKYDHRDLRNILERASARETVLRVAAGAVAKKFLAEFGVLVQSHVVSLGPVVARIPAYRPRDLNELSDASPVRMLDKAASRKAVAAIDLASRRGDTWGGVFEVVATGLPAGLGSHVQWDRKLDGRLAQSVLSIQAVKGVEIGQAFAQSAQSGSRVHDEIFWSKRRGFHHKTNRAGGIEGGITNGEPVVVRAAMKPISTLKTPLRSVHIDTKEPLRAGYERSDICALPAAAVIGEAACAWVLADALLEKTGGDHLGEIRARILSLRRDHARF